MTFEDVKRIRQNPTTADVDNEELSKMIDIAVEKQIPKKPMGIYDENEHHIKDDDGLYEPALFGVCPICNQEVQDGMIYCSFCGQALDWSDTNDR